MTDEGNASHDRSSDPLRDLHTNVTPWLSCNGPESDVVLSSRVRLARNVAGFGFVHRCDQSERRAIIDCVRPALLEPGVLTHANHDTSHSLWLDVHQLDRASRDLLVERHMISPQLAKGTPASNKSESRDARAAVISLPDEQVSVMVNEEDHLRLQCIQPGLSLHAAYERLDRTDDAIESRVDYAYSARFGYLTACPTNVGSGARLSVMVHLPALQMLGEIDKVKRAASDMSLAVRGFWGEGSDHAGEFYQVSNQTTLGQTEAIMLTNLEQRIVPRIIEYERRARERLLTKRRAILEDTVFRAVGILSNARRISLSESMQRLSELRLGVAIGIVRQPSLELVSKLLLAAQAAHLQRHAGRVPREQLREARASFLRSQLRDANL